MSQGSIKHPSGIQQSIVDKVMDRRGGLYAFAKLDPTKTALVVIDLDMGTARNDKTQVAEVAARINNIASALRNQGGHVAWVTTPIQKASENFRAVFGDKLTRRYEADGTSGTSKTLWPELVVDNNDIHATKVGHSAFFPGRSDLHEQLQLQGITSLLIVGAVTNVCCEASARDAAELQYKVTMVSDAMIGWTKEQDRATYATFFRCYGDIRISSNVVHLIAG